MVRFVIIGIVIAAAFTLYALVDAAMTESSRARGVGKPVWVVLIVVLPVIGAALWFFIGKGAAGQRKVQAPDDDPRFTGTKMSTQDLDVHVRDLEARLKELDDETFPGEPATKSDAGQPSAQSAKPGQEAPSDPRGTAGDEDRAPGADDVDGQTGPEPKRS